LARLSALGFGSCSFHSRAADTAGNLIATGSHLASIEFPFIVDEIGKPSHKKTYPPELRKDSLEDM